MAEHQAQIMGILNVTPDSFSDGGRFTTNEAVQGQVEHMLAAGVDIIDVGGESTRPFAEPVSVDEELARVIPAIHIIRRLSDIPISIDTTKAKVALAALAAGATMVNDVSALRMDSGMVDVVRDHQGPVIIMHMQGAPGTMQLAPHYGDVIGEILVFFQERIHWMVEQGIEQERIIVDPGIGFGKSLEHNLEIIRNAGKFRECGCPVLIGHSRKSFLGGLLGLDVRERDCPTAVVSALLALRNVDILRVHDVRQNRQAVQLVRALEQGVF